MGGRGERDDLRDLSCLLRCSLRLKERAQYWQLYFFSGVLRVGVGAVVVLGAGALVIAGAAGISIKNPGRADVTDNDQHQCNELVLIDAGQRCAVGSRRGML